MSTHRRQPLAAASRDFLLDNLVQHVRQSGLVSQAKAARMIESYGLTRSQARTVIEAAKRDPRFGHREGFLYLPAREG